MRSFTTHNLIAVLMSGRPPINSKNIHKAKCPENISIYIKKCLFILALTCIVAENRRRRKRRTCWSAGSKRPTLGFKQPSQRVGERSRFLGHVSSGHSAKTRTLKTSCVLRPLECMHPAKWRLLRTIDYSHYSNWNDIIQPIDEYIISMSMRSHMCKLKFKTRMANTQFCRQQKNFLFWKLTSCWSDGNRSSLAVPAL